MEGGSQCGVSISSLIFGGCGLEWCQCESDVGSIEASGAVGSVDLSLKPPSGRRSGDPPRLCRLGVRGSCIVQMATTPGQLSCGSSSRSLVSTKREVR